MVGFAALTATLRSDNRVFSQLVIVWLNSAHVGAAGHWAI